MSADRICGFLLNVAFRIAKCLNAIIINIIIIFVPVGYIPPLYILYAIALRAFPYVYLLTA